MIDRLALQGFTLTDKTAAVLGCGGLGCNIATHLACAGIGKLLLIDFDTVSMSNLNRQFLYTAADVGKHKSPLAACRLQATAPDIRISAFIKKIETPADLSMAQKADILFLAVDNNAARSAAQSYCKDKAIPLVNGGINGFFGTAYLFIPGVTPDLTAAGMLCAENEKPRSVSCTVGLIGALEAQLGVRYLLGDTSAAGKLHILDGTGITLLQIKDS